MKWIVWKEEYGRIELMSEDGTEGMLPKGSYLTIEDGETKFILRVDESMQYELFEPRPLIMDMNLKGLEADRQCRNVVLACRVRTIPAENNGLIKYIRPYLEAGRSTQSEIDQVMNPSDRGPEIFIATVHANENQILRDESNSLITVKIPDTFYFHQTMICGMTGSGKTVAMKYLAQYFVEKMNGAVLAINVKDDDFLRMNKPSAIGKNNESFSEEWERISERPHGISNFTVYYPSTKSIPEIYNELGCEGQPITMKLNEIEPEALVGSLVGVADMASLVLPGIFRKWRMDMDEKGKNVCLTDFIKYISENRNNTFTSCDDAGHTYDDEIHSSTLRNILNCLTSASSFFDRSDAKSLDAKDILVSGKMSVVDIANHSRFGAIILRDILKKLLREKNNGGPNSKVDLLIIIDEVHQFFDDIFSRSLLSDLDTICRTGRSKRIGVFFASQNPDDMPAGLSSVINSKIFFKTDIQHINKSGISVSIDELEGLKSGYAIASFHNLQQLKIIKFPLSLSGEIFDDGSLSDSFY